MNKKIPTPLAILIIFLVIAAIIAISLWLCPEKETVLPQDETADWQTYRNEEYGFETKYPPNYEISTKIATNVGPAIVSNSPPVEITFLVYDNPDKILLSEWVKSDLVIHDLSIEWGRLVVNGIESLESPILGNMDKGIDYGVLIPQDDKIYSISFSTKSQGTENEVDVFKQILSTISFLEDVENCAIEGEPPTYLDLTTGKENPDGKHCCPGLKAIASKTPQGALDEGICLEIVGSLGICSPCGNGVCDSEHEDSCNCPEVCEKPTPSNLIPTDEGFCGISTYASCSSDLDCLIGGCSSELCGSRNEGPFYTTCVWRDCYDSQAYGVECKCVENKCQWIG